MAVLSVVDEAEEVRARMVRREPKMPVPVVASVRLSRLPWQVSSRRGKPLSNREVEVLALIRDGATNKEVGASLGISEQTVKNHMTVVLEKLDVVDRTAAIVKAAGLGLIAIPEAVPPSPANADVRSGATERAILGEFQSAFYRLRHVLDAVLVEIGAAIDHVEAESQSAPHPITEDPT